MMMAGYMSKLMGNISTEDLARMQTLIERARLPIYPPKELQSAQFLDLMAVDKKAQAGHIRLVLLQSLGKAYMTGDYDATLLDRTLSEWQQIA
jgi:3-dehydroquinate synthase